MITGVCDVITIQPVVFIFKYTWYRSRSPRRSKDKHEEEIPRESNPEDEQPVDEETLTMQQMMGFSHFDSSKVYVCILLVPCLHVLFHSRIDVCMYRKEPLLMHSLVLPLKSQ